MHYWKEEKRFYARGISKIHRGLYIRLYFSLTLYHYYIIYRKEWFLIQITSLSLQNIQNCKYLLEQIILTTIMINFLENEILNLITII